MEQFRQSARPRSSLAGAENILRIGCMLPHVCNRRRSELRPPGGPDPSESLLGFRAEELNDLLFHVVSGVPYSFTAHAKDLYTTPREYGGFTRPPGYDGD